MPSSPYSVPELYNIWDMDTIPKVVKGIYQRQVTDRGEEARHIKKHWWPILEDWKDRMSRRVYSSWIVGDITIPSPITDRVGLKYNQFFTIKPRISEKKRRKQSCTPNIVQQNIHV